MSQLAGSDYLITAIKRLKYYKELAEKTFEQLSEAELHYTPGPESNSIAIIIQFQVTATGIKIRQVSGIRTTEFIYYFQET